MSQLKQSNLSFGMFLSEFQRLHNLSGVTDDKTLISFMRNGVSNEMRICISQHQDIHKIYSFDEYVTLCKDCVVRLDLVRPTRQNNSRPTLRENNTTYQNAFIPANSGETPPINMNLPGVEPMDLDQMSLSHIGPDGHLKPEERHRRFRLKLCMRCGKPGHQANECIPRYKKKGEFQVAQFSNTEEKSTLNNLKD